jgi:hypothetical protein
MHLCVTPPIHHEQRLVAVVSGSTTVLLCTAPWTVLPYYYVLSLGTLIAVLEERCTLRIALEGDILRTSIPLSIT